MTTTTSPYYHPKKYAPSPLESTAPDATPLPVVIVGGGPIGMAVAAGLSKRGVPSLVLEAADQVSFGSRAICISRHSLEVAERLGFGSELEKIVLPWSGGRSFYRDQKVLQFQMPVSEHDVRGPMINVSQSEFEQIQVDELEKDPNVTLVWQAQVSRYTQDEDGVTLEVQTPDGTRRVRGRWVVAADGGRSRMRELSGFELVGTSYEGRYVIADIHWVSDLPAERHVWFDPPSNPGSTVIMHRQPNDIWRIDYQLDEGDDEEVETQEDRIKERIARHLTWLGDDRPWTLEWHGFYKAHARALESFVHGPVIFAGDAAHLVPIFGVRGLNSGMEDAETLAWMLAAVVNGTAEPSILETYSQERHSAWEQNIANAGKSTRIMTPGTDGFRGTRDAILQLSTGNPEFSHLINPRQSSATHAHTSPLTWNNASVTGGVMPGDPVEDRKVTTPQGESSLNRLRGIGFGLFGFGLDAAGAGALAAAAEKLAGRIAPEPVVAVAVAPTSDVSDAGVVVINDDLADSMGARPGEIYVVRPDGLLLARLSDPTEVDRVADSIASGRAPAGGTETPEWPDPTPPADQHREKVWLALSEGIDAAGPGGREGFLTRLALVLGSTTSEETMRDAVSTALGR